MHFAVVRQQPGQQAAQAQRLVNHGRAHQVITQRGRIAFVEDEVDHFQHTCQAGLQRIGARHFKRQLGGGQRALGAHNALRHGGLGHEEGAGNLIGAQAAQQLERERDPRIQRQHRVASREHQAQQVVANVIFTRRIEAIDKIGCHMRFQSFQVSTQFFLLFGVQRDLAQPVQRAVFGSGHQPGSRVVGHAVGRPMLQRSHQRVLRQLFGHAHIAHDACNMGDDLGRLLPPDGGDGLVGGLVRSVVRAAAQLLVHVPISIGRSHFAVCVKRESRLKHRLKTAKNHALAVKRHVDCLQTRIGHEFFHRGRAGSRPGAYQVGRQRVHPLRDGFGFWRGHEDGSLFQKVEFSEHKALQNFKASFSLPVSTTHQRWSNRHPVDYFFAG